MIRFGVTESVLTTSHQKMDSFSHLASWHRRTQTPVDI